MGGLGGSGDDASRTSARALLFGRPHGGFRHGHGLFGHGTPHEIADFVAVDFVARLHDLFFEGEIDLLEAGVDLLQGEHALVDDRDAEGGRGGGAGGVRDGELQPGLFAGPVGLLVEGDAHVQRVGGVDVQQARVADDVGAGREHVGLEHRRAEQRRVDVEFEQRLARGQFGRLCHDGLALAHQVEIDRARGLGGIDFRAEGITGAVQGLVGAEDDLFQTGLAFEVHLLFDAAALRIAGLHTQPENRPGVRRAGDRHNAQLVGRVVPGFVQAGDHGGAFRGAAIRVGHQHVEPVFEVRDQFAALGHHVDHQRRGGHRRHDHLLFAMVGGIHHGGLKPDRRLALFQRGPGEVVWQRKLERPVACVVQRAVYRGEVLEFHLEFGRGNGHFSAGHGFAEEVVGLNLPLERLARQVEILVGSQMDLVLGQHIAFDPDLLLRLGRAEDGPHDVFPEVDSVASWKSAAAMPNASVVSFFLKTLLPFESITSNTVSLGFRLQIGRAEAQRAHLDVCPGW